MSILGKQSTKGWTEERRKAQAERCRIHKPWEKSTWPRTAQGKAISRLNAVKSGQYARGANEFSKILTAHREFMQHYLNFKLMESTSDSALLEHVQERLNKLKGDNLHGETD